LYQFDLPATLAGMRRHTKSAAQWFSPADRRRLERALSTVREARLYRRIEAVLLVAEGQPISDAAQRVRATRLSVRRWVERYLAEMSRLMLRKGKRRCPP
jgi:transposase-like protein